MSEAITKVCQWHGCNGTGQIDIGHDVAFPIIAKCSECKGTGRVPDEIATLRAQLDAARAEVERLKPYYDTIESIHDALRETPWNVPGDLRSAVMGMLVAIDIRDAEVERLTEREREARELISVAAFFTNDLHDRRNAWLSGRKSKEGAR